MVCLNSTCLRIACESRQICHGRAHEVLRWNHHDPQCIPPARLPRATAPSPYEGSIFSPRPRSIPREVSRCVPVLGHRVGYPRATFVGAPFFAFPHPRAALRCAQTPSSLVCIASNPQILQAHQRRVIPRRDVRRHVHLGTSHRCLQKQTACLRTGSPSGNAAFSLLARCSTE